MSEATPRTAPYKGLIPYSVEDARWFFGREVEREIITANLLATRLTLLYGASGVGKSSILRAGVALHLQQQVHASLMEYSTPEFVVVVFNAWRDDPILAMEDHIREAVTQLLDAQTMPVSPSRGLVEILQAWTDRVGSDLLIILDQFEEYFLYHEEESGEGTFATEFPRAINHPDLRVNFLLSIREDALAKLDRFKGRIPTLFDNSLRILHLDYEGARAAIVEPIEQYNLLYLSDGAQMSIEPQLVEAVLAGLRTGQIALGEAGRGAIQAGMNAARIETAYLQLVMTRLWDEEMRVGSRTLRLETLARLGGSMQICRTYLDVAMSTLAPSEQDVAARVFHYLVTPSGTKIAHTVSDLAEYTRVPQRQLTPVLEKLSAHDIRVLRQVVQGFDHLTESHYEIFHDVLGPSILDWRARYVRNQERAEAERQLAHERRRVTRLRWGIVGLSLSLIVMVTSARFRFQLTVSANLWR